MNTTTNIYIVHTFKKIGDGWNRFHGVYSSKELKEYGRLAEMIESEK
jgi:hypothetical protein